MTRALAEGAQSAALIAGRDANNITNRANSLACNIGIIDPPLVGPLLDAFGKMSTDSYLAFSPSGKTLYISENFGKYAGATHGQLMRMSTIVDIMEFGEHKYSNFMQAFGKILNCFDTLTEQIFTMTAKDAGIRFSGRARPVFHLGKWVAVAVRFTPSFDTARPK